MGVGAEYFLVWSINGGEQKHLLKASPVFVGRLPYSFRSVVEDYSSLNVYIYYPSSREVFSTGLLSATVSRFHVKLLEEHGRFFLIDHGSSGKGSRNGVLLNGEKIPPGQRVLLKPGDSFRLGRLGPVFTLVMRRVDGDTIVLQKGIPTIMPRALAEKLATIEGIRIENYDRNTALVLASFKGSRRYGDLIVYAEEPSKRELRLKRLFQLENILIDALEYLKDHRDLDTAKTIVAKLKLKTYSELIGELGEAEIEKTYNEIIKIVAMDILDPETLKKRLVKLVQLVREYVENH